MVPGRKSAPGTLHAVPARSASFSLWSDTAKCGMSMERRFSQVDVFTAVPLRETPGGGARCGGLEAMHRWPHSRAGTNLSETTFLLPPRIRRRTISCGFSRL
jgi:hypothetical protein